MSNFKHPPGKTVILPGGLYPMKKVAVFFIFLVFVLGGTAQNLVRNPGMDSTNNCPAFLGDIGACQYWFNANSNDADYFHLCQPGLAPSNFIGWQQPRSDSGYLGFTAFLYYQTNARDYVRGELLSPLIGGKKYCFSFYVSLADSSNVAISNIGIYFSQNDPSILLDTNGNPNLSYLPYPPVYEPPRLQKDTSDWLGISGEFIAQGGEQYLTIGNFQPDINTTWDTIRPIPQFAGVGAYYYLDDVSVVLCEDTQPPPPPPPPAQVSYLTTYNAFSPNGDGVNDLFVTDNAHLIYYRLTIFNRWGNTLYETTDPAAGWNGTYQGGEVPDGTYFYLLQARGIDQKEYLVKGFISLLR
jgi:gliding motility-associated-like protein